MASESPAWNRAVGVTATVAPACSCASKTSSSSSGKIPETSSMNGSSLVAQTEVEVGSIIITRSG